MNQPNPDEALANELDTLCKKYNLGSGMLATIRDGHFLIITCDMTPENLRMLGNTILHCTTPSNAVLN